MKNQSKDLPAVDTSAAKDPILNAEVVQRAIDYWGIKKSHLIIKSGVSRATFYKYLKGDCPVTWEFIASLAHYLPEVAPIALVKALHGTSD